MYYKMKSFLRLLRCTQNSTLGKRFFKKYVILILVPLMVVTAFLSFSLYYIHINNVLYQQENYLKSIRKTWDRPAASARSVIYTLNSTAELGHYLERDYYSRPDRLYLYKKSLYSLFNSIILVNSDVDTIRIYGNDPDTLKVGPFHTMDDLPLKENELKNLQDTPPNELFWSIRSAASADEKPEFYAYSKLYSSKYVDFLGYVEIKIKNDFLEEYTELLSNNLYGEAGICLYRDETLIYNRIPFSLPDELTHSLSEQQKDYGIKDGYYFFKLEEMEYGLHFLILMPNKRLLSGYLIPLAVCIFFLVGGLFVLSLLFFKEISKLSKRIGQFSLYMKEYHKIDLKPYKESHVTDSDGQAIDEFSTLIQSFNGMISRNRTLVSQIHHLELLTKDAKLAAMQAQIHPHFIYGTLETIRMMALQNEDWEVENIVCSFSKLMRYSLNHPSEMSTLFKELEINRHYMNIQLVRFDERLAFEDHTDSGLPDICCPPFIIQPLLENAIVHGVSNCLQNCIIRLNTFLENDALIIQIADNGSSISDERLQQVNDMLCRKTVPSSVQNEQNGFALYNVSERLMLFYHERATLRLMKKDVWTISEIKIEKQEWEDQICSD